MAIEELKCDIGYVLQNGDFTILQTLMSSCYEFRTNIVNKIKGTSKYETECANKKTENVKRISELQQEIENVKSQIDAARLQKKIVDKKIANTVQKQVRLRNEVDEAKAKRDELSLEIIDLQLVLEERKQMKKNTWDAIKRACNTYKENLDFHIALESEEPCDKIKISFFTQSDNTNGKYYVNLLHQNNQWRVDHIEPEINKQYLQEFQGNVNFNKESEVLDVTAFLCCLRHIFFNYYIKRK